MDEATRHLLVAADNWLTAVYAVSTVDEQQNQSVPEYQLLDDTEVELAAMIMAWRNAGRPG